MEEHLLFPRVHEALDIDLPAGGYERLRSALIKMPAHPQRPRVLPETWSRTGFRVVAGIALVAVAATVAAAIVAKHSALNNPVPEGPRTSISAYQKMIKADYASAAAAWVTQCDIGWHTGCGTDAAKAIPVIQKWLDDLSRTATPARFVFIDAEMRAQLRQSLDGERALVHAAQANDGPAMDTAYIVSYFAVNWTATVVPAILSSRQVDAPTYRALVGQYRSQLDSCVVTCGMLATPQDCTLNNLELPCYDLFGQVAVQFTNFEASLVQAAAPDSLAAFDAQLQADVARANEILLGWRVAVAGHDQTGVDAGIGQLKASILKIDHDVDNILQTRGV